MFIFVHIVRPDRLVYESKKEIDKKHKKAQDKEEQHVRTNAKWLISIPMHTQKHIGTIVYENAFIASTQTSPLRSTMWCQSARYMFSFYKPYCNNDNIRLTVWLESTLTSTSFCSFCNEFTPAISVQTHAWWRPQTKVTPSSRFVYLCLCRLHSCTDVCRKKNGRVSSTLWPRRYLGCVSWLAYLDFTEKSATHPKECLLNPSSAAMHEPTHLLWPPPARTGHWSAVNQGSCARVRMIEASMTAGLGN